MFASSSSGLSAAQQLFPSVDASPLTIGNTPGLSALGSMSYDDTGGTGTLGGSQSNAYELHNDDIPAEYSHICHNYQACDVTTTAHLVINSLVLLGFNCDDYIDIYSGIAYDLPVLNVETFNKSNQKLLLIILHYVLSILDREEFLLAIHTCWPFLDNKEKSNFLRAIHQCLQRIISEEDNVDYRSAILIEAKGKEVWFLLRFLTDKCLQIMIKTYSSHGYSSNIHGDYEYEDESFYLESYQNKYLIPNLRGGGPGTVPNGGRGYGGVSDPAPPMPGVGMVRGISENHSMASSNLTESDLPGIDQNEPGAAAQRSLREIEDYLRKRIIEDIDAQVQELCTLVLDYNDEQSEWSAYISELEERLKIAQREIDECHERMQDLHQGDEHHLLSPKAEEKRTKTLQRIYGQKALLQTFLDSPLLANVTKYLEEEAAQQAAAAAHQSAAQANAHSKGQQPDLNEKAKERMAKILSPVRRAIMTQEELERHKANMRTAITQLIEKIDEVVGVL